MTTLSTCLGLGIRSDLMLLKKSGLVTEYPDGVCVISPGNPDFYFGNFFAPFKHPTTETITDVRKRFAELIGCHPGIEHESFAWSCQHADEETLEVFAQNGFRVEQSLVLTCKPNQLLSPNKTVPDLVIRSASQFDIPRLWQLYARFTREQSNGKLPLAERRFLSARIHEFIELIKTGMGNWHVAVINGRIVAALGLFFEGPIGRFQEVLTDSRWRNRGICAALVHKVSQDAFCNGVQDLIMVADSTYHALRVYRNLGFQDIESLITVCKSSRQDQNTK